MDIGHTRNILNSLLSFKILHNYQGLQIIHASLDKTKTIRHHNKAIPSRQVFSIGRDERGCELEAGQQVQGNCVGHPGHIQQELRVD